MIFSEMMHDVSRRINIPVKDIVGRSRFKEHVKARFLVAAIAHSHGMSMCAIGRRLHRDHTTIMSALDRFHKTADAATLSVFNDYKGNAREAS